MSPPSGTDATAAHNAVTLELAKKESAEHMHGMTEVYKEMRTRSLLCKAYAPNDPNAPSDNDDNVKTVHFLRHGQGFHNLMADLARAEGREWEQVRKQMMVLEYV